MSAKNVDKHNRWRNRTVAFRVSEEENEQINTAVAATPMPIALKAEVVTARVGQVPSTRQRTGFSLIMPLVSSLR